MTVYSAMVWSAVAVWVALWALEKIVKTARRIVGIVLLGAAVISLAAGCGGTEPGHLGPTPKVNGTHGTWVAPTMPPGSLLDTLMVDDRPELQRTAGAPYGSADWAFRDADGDGCRDDRQALAAAGRTSCGSPTGTWVSLYDGARHGQAAELEVDHVVARHDAWASGGAHWDPKQRADFVGFQWGLQPVTARVNSAKGDRGPDAWPFDGGRLAVKGSPEVAMAPGAWCTYARIYVGVKNRFRLTITTPQRDGLARALATCTP